MTLTTALASYMFAKVDIASERTARAGRVVREEGVSGGSFVEALSYTLDMAFLFTLDAVIMAAITGRLPGGDDDEDEGEGWATFLAQETAFGVLGTVPFIRDGMAALEKGDAGGAYGAIIGDLAKPFQQAAQGEVDRALVRAVIDASVLVTGAPAAQINRAVDAALRTREGEEVSPLEYVLGRARR